MSFFPTTILESIAERLKALVNTIQRPLWISQKTGGIRLVDNITNIDKVEIVDEVVVVDTLTDQTNICGFNARDTHLVPLSRLNWSLSVRPKIIHS